MCMVQIKDILNKEEDYLEHKYLSFLLSFSLLLHQIPIR